MFYSIEASNLIKMDRSRLNSVNLCKVVCLLFLCVCEIAYSFCDNNEKSVENGERHRKLANGVEEICYEDGSRERFYKSMWCHISAKGEKYCYYPSLFTVYIDATGVQKVISHSSDVTCRDKYGHTTFKYSNIDLLCYMEDKVVRKTLSGNWKQRVTASGVGV